MARTLKVFNDTRSMHVYLPARFRKTRRYPLLFVHDGHDYLRYASLGAILDNLIDRAAEVAGGSGPSLALLKSIIANGIHATKPGKSRQDQTKPDSKRVNDAWAGVPDKGYTF